MAPLAPTHSTVTSMTITPQKPANEPAPSPAGFGLSQSLLWLLPHKWLRPALARDWVLKRSESDFRFVVLLAFAVGLVRVWNWTHGEPDPARRGLYAVLLGPLLGLIVLYVGGIIVHGFMRAVGGHGTADDTRSGLAIAGIPALWALAVTAAIDRALPGSVSDGGPYAVFQVWLAGVSQLWSVWLAVTALSAVHAITGVRVFVALCLAGAVFALPSLLPLLQ